MQISAHGSAYWLSGPENAPAVVLIHGLGLSHQTTWPACERALTPRFRVLGYDLAGHGASAPAHDEVSLSSLGERLVALMDETGIGRAVLAGFSLGGMINRRVALDHPGRVAGLVILNSPHERAAELQQRVEEQARDAAAGGPEATVDAALERWFTPGFREKEAGTVARIRSTVLSCDPASYAAHRRVLAEGVRELIRPDTPLGCPALVMTGERDSGSTPEMARAIAGEISGSVLGIVPGLRHLGLIERPDLFVPPVLDFLDRVAD